MSGKITPCVFLGQPTGDNTREGHPVHECRIHGRCTTAEARRIASCPSCKQRLLKTDANFARDWQDPLVVINSRSETTTVLRHTVLHNRAAVLFCGGPSTKSLDLSKLNQRGVFTLCVNQSAAKPEFRPQAFVCADDIWKFHPNIWLDPQIMKFIPHAKFRGYRSRLRRKARDGYFDDLEERSYSAPNTWGFHRRNWFLPDDSFFMEPSASWGNLKDGAERTGLERSVCTTLIAIRLLYYLGARTIFLVGVDFHMTPSSGYSFSQDRTAGSCRGNNNIYRVVNSWLCLLQDNGVFDRFGLKIYNCNQSSHLRAFPYVRYEHALKVCTKGIDLVPDLSGWYEKDKDRKDIQKQESS